MRVIAFLILIGLAACDSGSSQPYNLETIVSVTSGNQKTEYCVLSDGSIVWSRVYIELKPGEVYYGVAKVKS